MVKSLSKWVKAMSDFMYTCDYSNDDKDEQGKDPINAVIFSAYVNGLGDKYDIPSLMAVAFLRIEVIIVWTSWDTVPFQILSESSSRTHHRQTKV